jgi:hypothetical protein
VIENDVVCQLDDDVSGNLQCQPDNKVYEQTRSLLCGRFIGLPHRS